MKPDFSAQCRHRAVRSLAAFGDSITEGMSASLPERRWPNLLAQSIDAPLLSNRGIAGTVMQMSPMADGSPKPNNGRARFESDLLGAARCDAVAILYGFNDARYIGAPATFNAARFVADFRHVLARLLAGGYEPATICLGSPPYIPDAGFAVGTAGFAGQSRQAFQAYVGMVEGLAREFALYYAPVNERMAEEGGDWLISPDHVHPNDAGHQKIAQIFASARRT